MWESKPKSNLKWVLSAGVVVCALVVGLRSLIMNPDAVREAAPLTSQVIVTTPAPSIAPPISLVRSTAPVVRTSAALTTASVDMLADEGFRADMVRVSGNGTVSGTVYGVDALACRTDGEALVWGTDRYKEYERCMISSRVPLAGARISLISKESLWNRMGTDPEPLRLAVTDSKGSFTLENITESRGLSFVLCATHPGYLPATCGIAENIITRAIIPNMEIRLLSGCETNGTVRHARTGEALADVPVYAIKFPQRIHTKTDAAGNFTLKNALEFLKLNAVKEGWYVSDTRAHSAEHVSTVHIEMLPGVGTISGQLVNETSAPIKAMGKVLMEVLYDDATGLPSNVSASRTYLTDEKGQFTLTDVPAERKIALAARRGMNGEKIHLTLEPNEHREGVELCVVAPLLVTGRVVTEADNEPVVKTELTYRALEDAWGTTFTGANGEFSIVVRVSPTGEFKIGLDQRDGEGVVDAASGEVNLADPFTYIGKVAPKVRETNVTIKLRKLPTLTVKFVDEKGDPVWARARAVHVDDDGKPVVASASQTLRAKPEVKLLLPPNCTKGTSLVYAAGGDELAIGDRSLYVGGRLSGELMMVERTGINDEVTMRVSMNSAGFSGTICTPDGAVINDVAVSVTYCDPASSLEMLANLQPFTTGHLPRFVAAGISWSTIRWDFIMPDGKSVSVTGNGQDFMGKKALFTYEPQAARVTVRPVELTDEERQNPHSSEFINYKR